MRRVLSFLPAISWSVCSHIHFFRFIAPSIAHDLIFNIHSYHKRSVREAISAAHVLYAFAQLLHLITLSRHLVQAIVVEGREKEEIAAHFIEPISSKFSFRELSVESDSGVASHCEIYVVTHSTPFHNRTISSPLLFFVCEAKKIVWTCVMHLSLMRAAMLLNGLCETLNNLEVMEFFAFSQLS